MFPYDADAAGGPETTLEESLPYLFKSVFSYLKIGISRAHFCGPIVRMMVWSLLCPTLVSPWTVTLQAPLTMEVPGKNTGVGCISFSRGSP